jgi:acyl carrier protein
MSRKKQVADVVLARLFRFEPEDRVDLPVLRDRLLKDHLGIKSLQMASLLTDICGELDIDLMTMSDIDIVRMKTVEDVIDILSQKKSD